MLREDGYSLEHAQIRIWSFPWAFPREDVVIHLGGLNRGESFPWVCPRKDVVIPLGVSIEDGNFFGRA